MGVDLCGRTRRRGSYEGGGQYVNTKWKVSGPVTIREDTSEGGRRLVDIVNKNGIQQLSRKYLYNSKRSFNIQGPLSYYGVGNGV